MPFVLALDQGTTSSRAIVFDAHGTARLRAAGVPPDLPRAMSVDATEIWATQSGVSTRRSRKLASLPAKSRRLTTNQRENRSRGARGKPIANAIVWQDRRTASTCDALRDAGHAPTFLRKTGLVLDAPSGTKLKWLLDHVRRASAKRRAGLRTVDTYSCGT